MKYPFTPEILDAMPDKLAELYRELESYILREICTQLKIGDGANEVTLNDIRILRSHGISLDKIKAAIEHTSGKSREEVEALLQDAVERNEVYYDSIITLAALTRPEALVNADDIDAIFRQTDGDMRNITQSMGFYVRQGADSVLLPPGQAAYQWALDNAALRVTSGATSYNAAIKDAVKELADSGLKTVDYDSGHVDSVDVAVRRAVMTGVSQISDKYTVQAAEALETNYYEISAHRGARDKGIGWQNHKSWQGKVYSTKSGDIYPSIYTVCGLGEVDGLEGANCRHRRFPWIEGVSERTYTDEQLANIDRPPFEFEGRTYTAYEATQKQRMIERTIRKLKREQDAYQSAGLTDDANAVGARIRRLNGEYKAFSKAADLPEQRERMQVYKPIK